MIGTDVDLIAYSEKVDLANCLTHALGAVLSAVGLIMLLMKAEGAVEIAAAAIYGVSLTAVYTVSAVYHGLKSGETKRRARIADHTAIPVLIAGTATPCALVTLRGVSTGHCLLVFLLAWFCAVFGIISKIFFFEKLKALTMTLYIVSGAVMLFSVVPILDRINIHAFDMLLAGCVSYVIGAILCGLGRKTPWLHIVFHVFVLLGSALHFWAIYQYIF